MSKKKKKKSYKKIAIVIAAVAILFMGVYSYLGGKASKFSAREYKFRIPTYSGQPYTVIHDNMPFFEEADYQLGTFESYSPLDILGRCGEAYACISRELMPESKREPIGDIKPTGWAQKKYEGIVNSSPPYLYNRCHLIAYCLTGENANERNLITGTRYMNVEGMLPFEEMVAKYLDENDAHVLYRVTPVFQKKNLLASGVLIEAYSIEDRGEGICFCVYCHNVQPGVEIDYKSGNSLKRHLFCHKQRFLKKNIARNPLTNVYYGI